MFNTQILAGSSGQGGEVQQSLKFNDDESQYLSWTPAAAGNRKTFTYSSWVKRGKINADNPHWGMSAGTLNNSSNARTEMLFNPSDNIVIGFNTGSWYESTTDAKFRDASAWYHFVVTVDMTQSTASDRLKFYVNGELQTFSSYSVPNQNTDLPINNTLLHGIGEYIAGESSASYQFDGYLSDINFIDGQALDPTSFGQFTSGYWEKIDYAGTYGTNGFHLTFQDDVVSEGFNTVTYTGTGVTNSVSGLGFSPDLVWIKGRNIAYNHRLYDTVRGVNKRLYSDLTNGEYTSTQSVMSFDADGFTLGTDAGENNGTTPGSFVAWAWDAGGAPTADNSAGAGATPTAGSVKIDGSNLGSALGGSIAATRISANTARGFSIISFAGNATAGATVAHSLNSTPEMLILKNRDSASEYWTVFHKDVGNTKSLFLNSNGAVDTSSAYWNNTSPTSSVFSLGGNPVNNGSGNDIICYAFHSVSGYSKFDTYTGNGSSTGPVVSVGFRPAFLMVKRTDDAFNWMMIDNTRSPVNPNTLRLQPNSSNAEDSNTAFHCDLTSDGFQFKTVDGQFNASGGTYIYMAFADTREAAFWKDVSGQGNHWTPSGLDYRDSLPDSPANNFATFNALVGGTRTLSEGNLKQYLTATSRGGPATFTVPQSGKWYWETMANDSNGNLGIGVSRDSQTFWTSLDAALNASYYANGEYKIESGTQTSGFSAFSNGDILSVAVDADVSPPKIYFGYNGTWQNSADPAAGTGGFSLTSGETYLPMMAHASGSSSSTATMNLGQDSTFSGAKPMGAFTDDSQLGTFQHQPPAGFKSLCSQNLPIPTIVDGTEYFNTVTYTGTGATTLSITGVGFRPDWVWAKKRSASDNHAVADTVRGVTKTLFPNTDGAESTDVNGLKTFDSDGFTIGSGSGSGVWGGNSGATYVAWNWKINAGTSSNVSAGGSSNIRLIGAGTADQAAVQVNTEAGISIVSFENTVRAADGFCTFPHGLGSAPDMVWLKSRTSSNYWAIYHSALGLNLGFLGSSIGSNAFISSTYWNAVSSSTVKFQSNGNLSATDEDIIAYCFKSIEGYSRAGSYTGNGNADGNFIYTGFRPAWILIKNATDNSEDWEIHDATRDPFNVTTKRLKANTSGAEVTATFLDFVSNGVKIRSTGGGYNSSGKTFIYLAFAESPFKYANAR